jgi:sodium-dependent dicarboxylate transporter 2/3/5
VSEAESEAGEVSALRRMIGLGLAPAAFVAVLLAPLGLEPAAQRMAAIVAWTVALWVSEAIPLAATGLLAPALAVLLGVAPASEAFAPIASPLIFLFLGGFMIARALATHGVDRRAALWLLTRPVIGGSPARVVVAIAVASFVGSMWLSNTATTAMLLPVGLGLCAALRALVPAERQAAMRRYAAGMALAIAYASSLGGMATPIGTAPNVITLDLLERQAGIRLDFFEWMSFALPVGALSLVALLVWLRLRYPPPVARVSGLAAAAAAQREALGALSAAERRVIGVFGVAVAGWLAPSILKLSLGSGHPASAWAASGLDEGVVAIAAASLLFILPRGVVKGPALLPWREAAAIDWGTLYLLGGGLALGKLMFDTGLASAIAAGALALAGPLAGSPFGLLVVSTLLMTTITEITSNTAATSMMIPVLLAISVRLGIDPLPMALCVTLAASNAFMMPVSTPPNAIVYGGGYVRLGEMLRTGAVMDVVGFIILIAAGALLLPLLGLG